MKRTVLLLLILALTIGSLTACGEQAQSSEPTDAPTEAAPADTVLTDEIRAQLAEEFEAIFTQRAYEGAVYIVYRGEEVYSGGTGAAVKDSDLNNSADVVFHIASVSKQFTAAAILRLCEQGRMTLDDPLSLYFPDYVIGREITVRDLLTMQSGIPDYVRSYDADGNEIVSAGAPYVAGVAESNTAEENLAALQAYIFAQELLFVPGERYSYSNANYVLLGLIFEQVSGTGLEDYIRTSFFEPLGMDTAGFMDDYDNPDATVAKAYHRANGSELLTYPGCSFGCAGIMASPKDLYRWTTALHGGEVLGDGMYREMITAYADTGSGASYGCGLMIAAAGGITAYYHPGSLPGFISFVGYIPEKDYFIALMSNHGCETTPGVANKLTEIFRSKVE